ncbi:MAG: Uma2 family endonuclease, partial [Planctomycetota bacterium]
MPTLDRLIDPIRHSPRLPELVRELSALLELERDRREKFYDDVTPEQKAEFIEGEVIVHSPARSNHLDVTLRVAQLLHTFVQIHQLGTVKSEKCLCVFPRNDYEPDVVFFSTGKAATFRADTMKFPIPDLVVEVLSESTQSRDRGVKFEDYAAGGVHEYWIVDADQSVIEQYRLRPASGENEANYELVLKAGQGMLHCAVI